MSFGNLQITYRKLSDIIGHGRVVFENPGTPRTKISHPDLDMYIMPL